MALLDDALALALTFVPEEAGDTSGRMLAFCKAAELELVASLRDGVTEEDCGDALSCAVAWLALSYYCAGRSFDPERFTVGDLTVEQGSGSAVAADCLRTQARLLMAPYSADETFGFRGGRV